MGDTRAIAQCPEVVVLLKMDGENTTMYREGLHARSMDFAPHPSRTRIKALYAQVRYLIPEGHRVCGENMTAKHSIHYLALRSYFQVFSIWNAANVCVSWNDTEELCRSFGLATVPVLWRGKYDEERLRRYTLLEKEYEGGAPEGFVVRPAGQFHFKDFGKLVGKYVRAGHVQTSKHWRNEKMVPNLLLSGNDA